MKKLIVLGAGGYAQEVLWIVDDINLAAPAWDFLGFIDPQKPGQKSELYDRPVLGGWEAVPDTDELFFVCGIGSPKARRKVCGEAEERGLKPATLIHPSVKVARHVEVGEGTVIGAGSFLGPYVTLGRHCSLNIGVNVGHDTQVGGYSVLSPGACLLGNSRLAEGVFVGAGATVYMGRSVGEGAIVGANSFLLTNQQPATTVIGVPAVRLSATDGSGICTAREAQTDRQAQGSVCDQM